MRYSSCCLHSAIVARVLVWRRGSRTTSISIKKSSLCWLYLPSGPTIPPTELKPTTRVRIRNNGCYISKSKKYTHTWEYTLCGYVHVETLLINRTFFPFSIACMIYPTCDVCSSSNSSCVWCSAGNGSCVTDVYNNTACPFEYFELGRCGMLLGLLFFFLVVGCWWRQIRTQPLCGRSDSVRRRNARRLHRHLLGLPLVQAHFVLRWLRHWRWLGLYPPQVRLQTTITPTQYNTEISNPCRI